MRLPRLIRSTPFRLTLLFLALFAAAASAFLGYIYIATAGEVNRRADADITREMESLEAAYRQGGVNALNQTIVERATGERPFLYLLLDKDGKRISGSIEESPVDDFRGPARPGRRSRSPRPTSTAPRSNAPRAGCRSA
jgi:Na+-translocating ferredoxin:NAD+ oxidoreductase RnfG subunit